MERTLTLSTPSTFCGCFVWTITVCKLAAIPVYCELARETLIAEMQISNNRRAFLASHMLSWTIVALTHNSALFEAFVERSSLRLLGFANFSLPLLLDHHYTMALPKLHRRRSGMGHNGVVWALALVTASIASVIVQRSTDSILLAEGTFMATVLLTFQYDS